MNLHHPPVRTYGLNGDTVKIFNAEYDTGVRTTVRRTEYAEEIEGTLKVVWSAKDGPNWRPLTESDHTEDRHRALSLEDQYQGRESAPAVAFRR